MGGCASKARFVFVYGIKKVQDECMWCLKRTYRHGDSVGGVVVMHAIHREKEFQVPKVILFFHFLLSL